MSSRLVAFAVAAVLVAVTATTALAGHQTSGVKSYTGCLVSGDGVIVKIKEGNAPKSACSGGQVESHFSGGDITKISVGSGLSLPNGGDNGEVRIVLDASHALPQGCADGRVAEWDSGTDRWICGVDNDTTYAAGTGLDLDLTENPDEFSIEPAFRLPSKACSTAGEFARGFNSSGEIQCQSPTSSGIEVWQKIRPAIDAGTVVKLPKGEGVDVVIMPMPAGTFLITAVAVLVGEGGDDELSVSCFLRDGAFNLLPVHPAGADIGDGSFDPVGTVTVHGVVSLANADTVRFTCRSGGGDADPDAADSGTVTAIKVGTVHTP